VYFRLQWGEKSTYFHMTRFCSWKQFFF